MTITTTLSERAERALGYVKRQWESVQTDDHFVGPIVGSPKEVVYYRRYTNLEGDPTPYSYRVGLIAEIKETDGARSYESFTCVAQYDLDDTDVAQLDAAFREQGYLFFGGVNAPKAKELERLTRLCVFPMEFGSPDYMQASGLDLHVWSRP